jgi:hypothetical protein
MPTIAAAVVCFYGAFFSLKVAIFDWEASRENFRAVIVEKAFGAKGARAFYVILGTILFGLGFGALLSL